MQKLGKGFFPTAASVARATFSGQGPGTLLVRSGRLASGQSVQFASFRPAVPASMRSIVSSSSSSSSQGMGAAKDIRSREVAPLSKATLQVDGSPGPRTKAAAPERDSKGSAVPEEPQVDAEVLALHAQMYEHDQEPVPDDGDLGLQVDEVEEMDISNLDDLSAQIDLDDVLIPQSLFVPRKGQTRQIAQDTAASSAQAKDEASDEVPVEGLEIPPTIDMGSVSWQQALLKTLPKGSKILALHDAADVNRLAAEAGEHPQWKPKTLVAQVTIPGGTVLWQAVSDEGGKTSQHANLLRGNKYFGRWFLLAQPGSATDARVSAAILRKFKAVISHAATLFNQREVTGLIGVARGMGGFKGGAVQFFCAETGAFQLGYMITLRPESKASSEEH